MDTLDEETRKHYQALQQRIGHNFASVLNNPRETETKSWGGWLDWDSWSSSDAAVVPPPNLTPFPQISYENFQPYCTKVDKALAHFSHAHQYTRENEAQYRQLIASKQQPATKQLPHIPPEFFREEFDFFTTAAFDSLPQGTVELVEQLGEFMTEVEEELAQQVRARSDQFFQALTRFQSLQHGVVDACDTMSDLRSQMTQLDEEVVGTCSRVASAYKRKRNIEKLCALLTQVEQIRQVQSRVRVLMAESDFSTCIDLLNDTLQTLEQEDVGSLTTLKHVKEQLVSAKDNVRDVIRNSFLMLLVPEKASNVVRTKDDFVEGGATHLELHNIVMGLLKLRHSHDNLLQDLLTEVKAGRDGKNGLQRLARDSVGDTLTQTLTLLEQQEGFPSPAAVQQTLAESTDTGKKTNKALVQVAMLTSSHFSFLMEQVFQSTLMQLETIGAMIKLLTIVLTECLNADSSGKHKPQGTFVRQRLMETLKETRTLIVHIIHTRIQKLFEVRQLKHEALPFNNVVDVMRLTFTFLNKSDSVYKAGATASQLRTTLISQCKLLFTRIHERNLTRLTKTHLAKDDWAESSNISQCLQLSLNDLVDCSDQFKMSRSTYSVDAKNHPASTTCPSRLPLYFDGTLPDQHNKQTVGRLQMPGTGEYPLSCSTLELLKCVADYEAIMFCFPFIATEVVQRLHDLTKAFDRDVVRLVLGAGAIETAGLPSITINQLALASQCLKFVMELLTALIAKFRTLIVGEKTTQFVFPMLGKLLKDVTDHRAEFVNKIIHIVQDKDLNMDPSKWEEEGVEHIKKMVNDIYKFQRKLKLYFSDSETTSMCTDAINYFNSHLQIVFSRIPDAKNHESVQKTIVTYKTNIEKMGLTVRDPLVGPDANTEQAIMEYFVGS